MKKKYSVISSGAIALLLSSLCGSSFAASSVQEAGYCASPLLYATNIRDNCAQYGADGLPSLYQSSEFISNLKTSNDTKGERDKDLAS